MGRGGAIGTIGAPPAIGSNRYSCGEPCGASESWAGGLQAAPSVRGHVPPRARQCVQCRVGAAAGTRRPLLPRCPATAPLPARPPRPLLALCAPPDPRSQLTLVGVAAAEAEQHPACRRRRRTCRHLYGAPGGTPPHSTQPFRARCSCCVITRRYHTRPPAKMYNQGYGGGLNMDYAYRGGGLLDDDPRGLKCASHLGAAAACVFDAGGEQPSRCCRKCGCCSRHAARISSQHSASVCPSTHMHFASPIPHSAGSTSR